MKKIIAAIAVVALASSVCAARPTGLNIGGGLSVNSINSTSKITSGGTQFLTESAAYVGAFAEVGYDLAFSPIVGLYFGARYNWGFNGEFDLEKTSGSTDSMRWMSNITIPVHFAVNIPVGNSSFFFNLGPSVDFWLSYKGVKITATQTSSVSATVNYFDLYNFNKVNLYLGGKVGFNIRNHVKIYAAYDRSMINLIKANNTSAYSNDFRIGASYVF